MKSIFAILLILSQIISAQYRADDLELIRATFNRDFSDSVFTKYLNSNDTDKVNAALLSLSHSKDTSFIDQIISIDFSGHAQYITFALGQLGPSRKSTGYILEQLDNDSLSGDDSKLLFIALGLTGDSITSRKLVSEFGYKPGIPTALVNLSMRDIKDSTFLTYLYSAIDNDSKGSDLFELMYALYRIGPDERFNDKLIKILNDTSESVTTESKLYALGSLRRISQFNSPELARKLLSSPDWRIRTETAKALVNMNYESETELDMLLNLLTDTNPNVSRATASALKDVKLSPELNNYLTEKVVDGIVNYKYTPNAAGEAFVSLCALNPELVPDLTDDLERYVETEYLNRAMSYYEDDPEWLFEKLSDQLADAEEAELLSILPPLLSLQDKLAQDDDYKKTLITLLDSEYPSSISIIADGLDSNFVKSYAQILQQVVFDLSFKHMNDPQFIESLMSLLNLSAKISKVFETSIVDLLSSTKLASLKTYLNANYNLDIAVTNNSAALIDTLISKSFLYKEAVVTTEKGSFTMKLLPEFAPISVGNFCKLAEEKYFDGVIFHRVVPNFVIQTGDPSGTGWGGPGYEIVSEFSPLNYSRGMVGMASAGFDTEGSQWFVMHSEYPHLNGRYSIFAEVVKGMQTVDIIDQNDKIISVKLIK